jgi:sugar phosphate isomerase/epimerase
MTLGEAPRARFTVSPLMLPYSTFEEDVAACSATGFGMGVSEAKLGGASDEDLMELMKRSGVSCAVGTPAVIGPLKDAWRGGPDDPVERVDRVCDGIARLATFDPALILVVTGAKALYPVYEARRIIVEGLTRIASTAASHGLTVGVEVLRDEMNGSLYNDLPRTFQLLDDIGVDNLGVVFDVWHLWDAPGVMEQLQRYAPRISAVQMCDWRTETRWSCDRAIPGDGLADIPAILSTLETNGFTGVYELEVFSDRSKPESIWEGRTMEEVFEQSWLAFSRLWREAGLT